MRNLFLSSLVLAFMCVAVPVQAGLILNVGPTSGDLFFTGTDSGTPDFGFTADGGEDYVVNFRLGDGNFLISDSSSLSGAVNGGSGVTLLAATTGPAGPLDELFIQLALSSGGQQTLTGTGPGASVSAFSNPDSFAFLQTFTGQTLTRVIDSNTGSSTGTGFESLQIVSTNTVPEPGSLTVLALAGLSLVARRRRRC